MWLGSVIRVVGKFCAYESIMSMITEMAGSI